MAEAGAVPCANMLSSSEPNVPAVLCSKCGMDLPDGSQFCLQCGEPVTTTAGSTDCAVTTASLGCSGCGAKLPEGAQFCSRCGKSVSMPAKKKAPPPVDSAQPDDSPPSDAALRSRALSRRRNRRLIPWIVAGLLLLAIFWVATSDNPWAQSVQEVAGWKHDQGIVDNSFSVAAHNFRYYKFALPQGSMHVSIVGSFSSSSDTHSSRGSSQDADNNIEVYVMSESAFVAWQNGYNGTNVYESGRVSHGSMQSELPDGLGIYYLIFNNKFAPSTAKHVNADVLLRYKNWLPESFRRMSERFWNWIGL
jgi:ribosomal protein L40E